jgi:hypothetical protein
MSAAATRIAGIDLNIDAGPRVAPVGFVNRHLPWMLLIVLAVLFRIPPLLNARAVHSDAAVVGLQAMHLLKGEWAWFIWGAPYQGIIDVLLTAAAFAITGPSPLTLMLVPLIGHLVLIWLAFDILRKRVDVWAAFILCLMLVFTPQAINGVALYLPRQSGITLAFLTVWLLDRAGSSCGELLWIVSAAITAVLAMYADFFTVVFMPGVAVFAISCFLDGRPQRHILIRRAIAGGGALVVAGLLYWLVRRSYVPTSHKAQWGFDQLAENWKLLTSACLPWAMSYGVYVPGRSLVPQRWNPPGFDAFQIAAAVLLGLLTLVSVATLVSHTIAWQIKRLALFGVVIVATSFTIFLLSVMPEDMWGARYLAPIIWVAPLTLAPITLLFTRRQLLLLLGPYLVCAAAGGWVSYGPYVRGIIPVVSDAAKGDEERELQRFLRDNRIDYAGAQYWLAYRLTFLFGEEPTIYPPLLREDRYAPYREHPLQAAILHPSEPRLQVDEVARWLSEQGVGFRRFDVGKYTILKVQTP